MPAPGTVTDPNNPYKAIGGQTFGGGSSNAMYALQNPQASRMALMKAKMRAQAGMGAPVSQQDLYSDTAYGQFGFGDGSSRGGGQNSQRNVRIGNPGGVMAPPSPTSPAAGGSGGGGLGDLYAMNRKDPITGLDAMPSSFDRLQYNKGMENAGQFGAEAIGNQYLDNPGNPVAAGNLNSFRNARQVLMQNQPKQPQQAQFDGPTTFDADRGGWMPDHRAKGGPVASPHTYMVGEKGPEEFVGKDGKKQMIGMDGPEVGTFKEPGKVIPNNKLPRQQLQKMTHRDMGGAVAGSNIPGIGVAVHFPSKGYGAYPSAQIVNPMAMVHREKGGPVEGRSVHRQFLASQKPLPLPFSPLSPLGLKLRSGVNSANQFVQGGINAVKAPFADATAPNVTSPADLLMPENYGSSNVPALPAEDDEFPIAQAAPAPNEEPEWNPVPENPFNGPAWSVESDPRYAGNTFASPAPLPAEASPLDQSMYQNGATEIPNQSVGMRSFQLQLPSSNIPAMGGNSTGIGSVSMTPRTAESLIEGIPSSEFFKRAANRQGVANKFAAPDADSAAPEMNDRMTRNNRRARLGLAMGR